MPIYEGPGGALFNIDLTKASDAVRTQIDEGTLKEIEVDKPNVSDSKSDWVDYAELKHNIPRDTAEEMSKTDLIKKITELEKGGGSS
ncbi:MAG: hypothetical protein LC778_10270 [Acidobacteria bacterium]|nr:hypothetical protein [Acidobacteriota bacterium]